MRTEDIKADTIDEAAERILDELKDTTRFDSRNNIIYFDGWNGLGASAVLRAVASKAPGAGLEFVHIDCSKWESKRALQRVIARQLNIPTEMMQMLDIQDEDDDFNGVAQDSRAGIPQMEEAIYQRMQKLSSRFFLIFQNGSHDEVDLSTFGIPLYGYTGIKVLWTFQGSLRLYPKTKVDSVLQKSGLTDVFFSATCNEQAPLEPWWAYLVHQEAVEVARRNAGINLIDRPTVVSNCFTYVLKLCSMGHQSSPVFCDLATHVGNYLICDGTIQANQQGDIHGADDLWQAADALQREMKLDLDYYGRDRLRYSHLVTCTEVMPRWSSPTYWVTQILDGGILTKDNMFSKFTKFNMLRILGLSHCNFIFSSPPFLCCNNLRFLMLNHCQDQAIINAGGAGEKEEEDVTIRHCFQKLWVLDIRYTRCSWFFSAQMLDLLNQLRELNVMGAQDWDMGQLLGRLPNVRKLRVTKSTINCSENGDLFPSMKKLELFEFSGNSIRNGDRKLTIEGNSSRLLETIIIDDGCDGLQQMSFRGCAKLKNIAMRGFFNDLQTLDISGTAVKILDLSATSVWKLDEIIALGCNKLCAVMWPHERGIFKKVRIDNTTLDGARSTRGTTSGSESSSAAVNHGSREPTEYNWYVFIKDARLLRSLFPFQEYLGPIYGHMEVSSAPSEKLASLVNAQPQQQPEITNNATSIYDGIAVTLKLQQTSQSDAPTITKIWPCPSAPLLGDNIWYVHIQDQPTMTKSRVRQKEAMGTNSTVFIIPDRVCCDAKILDVHDNKSIICVPGPHQGSRWSNLEWCRVERCPSLECVFFIVGSEPGGIFINLEVLWSSQLRNVRCIWYLSSPSSVDGASLEQLNFMHVDLCPRLTLVLPLSAALLHGYGLRNLETIEIVWCGSLRAVFPTPLDSDDVQCSQEQQKQQQMTVTSTTTVVIDLPVLRRIHLHELPMLHGICGRTRICAPNLQSIKIRGCWSLKRLPIVGGGGYEKRVKCNCEREWWDILRWDGKDARHHPSFYKATHPRHYKTTRLRGSVLV